MRESLEPLDELPNNQHKERNIILTIIAIVVMVMIIRLTAPIWCSHSWVETERTESTCTSLGSERRTCDVCGLDKTIALAAKEHEWKEASCEMAKMCINCKKTEGKPLGHVPGKWIITDSATVISPGTETRYCTRCDVEVENRDFKLTSYVSNGKFMFSPFEFSERLKTIGGEDLEVYLNSTNSGDIVCNIYKNNESVAFAFFTNEERCLTNNDKYSKAGIDLLTTKFVSKDANNLGGAMLSIIMTCDPSLTFDEADNLCTELLNKFVDSDYNMGLVEKNNITYAVFLISDSLSLWVTTLP